MMICLCYRYLFCLLMKNCNLVKWASWPATTVKSVCVCVGVCVYCDHDQGSTGVLKTSRFKINSEARSRGIVCEQPEYAMHCESVFVQNLLQVA